jgi:hypothetical protein
MAYCLNQLNYNPEGIRHTQVVEVVDILEALVQETSIAVLLTDLYYNILE